MRIALVNAKGGSGKTTTAVLLYLALREAGHRVDIDDRDPQRTLTRCLTSLEVYPAPSSEAAILIIDTPPRLDGKAIMSATEDAERILVPTRPGPADLWAAQETAAALKERGHAQKARILWNAIRPGTIFSRGLEDSAQSVGLKPMKAAFALREAYGHALILGWKALDREAREEVAAVALAALAK